MSDIPLRTFGRSSRNRSGYTPLRTEHDDYDASRNENGSGNSQHNMPAQTTITNAAASAASHRWKGKKKQTYQDDPEEQEGLLGDDDARDSEEEVGRAVPARLHTHEVCCNPYITQFCLMTCSG